MFPNNCSDCSFVGKSFKNLREHCLDTGHKLNMKALVPSVPVCTKDRLLNGVYDRKKALKPLPLDSLYHVQVLTNYL